MILSRIRPIIEGAGSFTTAFIALAFLSDYVGSRTRVCVATQRIEFDTVSVSEEKSTVWNGLSLAVKDSLTWVFACMQEFYVSSHGLNGFFPSIVQGLRLSSQTKTLLLMAPPYLLAAAIALLVSVSSDRRTNRSLHVIGPTTNHAARYFFSFLYVPGAMASTGLIFSWASAVMSETPEKRAAGMEIACLKCQLGGVWSP
ncbi:major facilitator superfamily transporter [Colletotrichum incanum]|uniref:Major facilitator superfamily transporter n=1 Tax=Colletotrichum incanum TaxID=1573173 RepID=A0A167BE66_COLIC|nr:major facilitator superfamily transporter [Colletotrichum incanum]OHX00011.1 hypothetical protein CSPAE12_01240 [Colletotrichum incanum]